MMAATMSPLLSLSLLLSLPSPLLAGRPPPSPPPNLAYTCAAGSPGAALPFCDRALGFEKRTADLVARPAAGGRQSHSDAAW